MLQVIRMPEVSLTDHQGEEGWCVLFQRAPEISSVLTPEILLDENTQTCPRERAAEFDATEKKKEKNIKEEEDKFDGTG